MDPNENSTSSIWNRVEVTEERGVMVLSKFNSRITEDEEKGASGWDLRAAAATWVLGQTRNHYRTITELKAWENETINKMNQWCGRMLYEGPESKIAVRKRNGNLYEFDFMSVQRFKSLFFGLEVVTYNNKDWVNVGLFDSKRFDSVGLIGET